MCGVRLQAPEAPSKEAVMRIEQVRVYKYLLPRHVTCVSKAISTGLFVLSNELFELAN